MEKNDTELDDDEWAVVEWLKAKGYKISKCIWKEL